MRWWAVLAIAALVVVRVPSFAAPAPIEVKSSIEGEVVQVVSQNAAVRDGDVLLVVSTATRARVDAATAPADGTIVEVRVKVGDRVAIGTVVAILQPR